MWRTLILRHGQRKAKKKKRALSPVVLEVVDGIAVDVLHQVLRHHVFEQVPLVASAKALGVESAALAYNYYYPKPKYLIIGYMDP